MADSMPGKVEPFIIRKRSAELNNLSNEIRKAAHQRQIGEILEVIPEQKTNQGGDNWGVADNFLKVKLPNTVNDTQALIKIMAEFASNDYVEGRLVS